MKKHHYLIVIAILAVVILSISFDMCLLSDKECYKFTITYTIDNTTKTEVRYIWGTNEEANKAMKSDFGVFDGKSYETKNLDQIKREEVAAHHSMEDCLKEAI